MKPTKLASLLLLVAAAACQNGNSKLDTSTGAVPKEGNAKGGAGGAVGGGGGGADARAVEELRQKVASLEAQLGRLGSVEKDLAGYQQYRTALDIVAAKVKADSGQFTVPSEIVIDSRLKALERYAETFEWIAEIHEQQKKQQEAKEAQELDPTASYAVDIDAAIKAGQIEGPAAGAYVTIVEAWDFA
ncbi:MAG: hypothetical protein KF773_00255 [Deltaproteobacteria bacterium]|nr:hypothetical protein [Deltaproteobacteria bacterium]